MHRHTFFSASTHSNLGHIQFRSEPPVLHKNLSRSIMCWQMNNKPENVPPKYPTTPWTGPFNPINAFHPLNATSLHIPRCACVPQSGTVIDFFSILCWQQQSLRLFLFFSVLGWYDVSSCCFFLPGPELGLSVWSRSGSSVPPAAGCFCLSEHLSPTIQTSNADKFLPTQ